MINWFDDEGRDQAGEFVFSIKKARKSFDVVDLVPNIGFLILNAPVGTDTLNFAVMKITSNDEAKCVFHGVGEMGTRRKYDRIYWGESGDGYVYMPSVKLLSTAVNKLSEFFDNV